MSASHADSALKVIVAVLATLTIYWGAERYARIVSERIHEGHRPNWSTVRHQLTHGWEMVTASALPLTVLVVLSALGTQLYTAVISRAGLQHGPARRGGLGHGASRLACRPGSGSRRRRSPRCSASCSSS